MALRGISAAEYGSVKISSLGQSRTSANTAGLYYGANTRINAGGLPWERANFPQTVLQLCLGLGGAESKIGFTSN